VLFWLRMLAAALLLSCHSHRQVRYAPRTALLMTTRPRTGEEHEAVRVVTRARGRLLRMLWFTRYVESGQRVSLPDSSAPGRACLRAQREERSGSVPIGTPV